MSTIPFAEPKFFTAKRISGFVDIPENNDDEHVSSPMDWGNGSFNAAGFTPDPEGKDDKDATLAGPTHLRRTSTMAGNIVVIEVEGSESQAFWLQRKVGHTMNGSIRLGFVLRSATTTSDAFNGPPGKVWSLAPGQDDDGDPTGKMKYQMVAIKILDTCVLNSNNTADAEMMRNPLNEFSAFQLIADYYEKSLSTSTSTTGTTTGHVIATKLIAVSSQHVYAILPYYPDGTLFQYCLAQGSLKETVARFFFRQILKGMQTLQAVGLCHRNLSLEAISMDGSHLHISRLGWSLRVGKGNGGGGSKQDSDGKKPVPPPGGSSPQFIAPEVFQNNASEWDGYAADLWACGLILYGMVVSSQALFMAPIPEDRVFIELCVKGNITKQAEKFGKMTNTDVKLSDDLVDLLQNMLKVDPQQRMTLAKVLEHPWVTKDEVEIPSPSSLAML